MTLNEYLVAMRAFLKWVQRLGYITRNPLEKIELLRIQGRQKRARQLTRRKKSKSYWRLPDAEYRFIYWPR